MRHVLVSREYRTGVPMAECRIHAKGALRRDAVRLLQARERSGAAACSSVAPSGGKKRRAIGGGAARALASPSLASYAP
jgi:hypothetical protein